METISSVVQAIVGIPIVIILVIIAIIIFKLRYKVAKGNQALVITGGKKGVQVLTAGGIHIAIQAT